jgi:hypothetical protein
MASKFRIGDKVRVTAKTALGSEDRKECYRKTGTVRFFQNTKAGMGLRNVGVDFGKSFKGHDLNGALKTMTGRFYYEKELTLVKQKPKIGSTVVMINDDEGLKGKRGKVVLRSTEHDDSLGIDFGAGYDGHDFDGVLKTRTGWYVNKRDVRVVARAAA